MDPRLPLALILGIAASCNSSAATRSTDAPFARVECWGEMREVLREGRSHGRVRLRDVVETGTWGVGALAELAGEVTVLDGEATLAVVRDGELQLRAPRGGDLAALLVLATVEGWRRVELPQACKLADLELVIAQALERAGFDPGAAPVPLRVEGSFDRLDLHVIAGACPVADPGGAPPWRWSGAGSRGTLVGIHAAGAAGRLTHHGRSTHLHAVVETVEGERVSGHVEELALGADAVLFVPAARSLGD